MGATIFLGLLGLVAVIGLLIVLVGRGSAKGIGAAILGGSLIIGLIVGFFSMTVTNDEGQAKVLRSWTGQVEGEILTPGFKTKAPWQSALTYDVRNQQVIFASSKGEPTANANGPQITIQDKEGVSANIDISVRYSIDPASVVDIYKKYGSPENFVSKFIENDIRAGVRTVPAKYGTLELLNNRAKVETEITEYLDKRWDKAGVRVETVSLQEIRYPEDVQQRFAEAQNARTEVEKANAELEANKVKAESNRVLAQSITEQTIEQLKYETLREIGKNDNLVIVPENFNGMVNVGK